MFKKFKYKDVMLVITDGGREKNERASEGGGGNTGGRE